MIYRELKEWLGNMDEEQLDMEAVVFDGDEEDYSDISEIYVKDGDAPKLGLVDGQPIIEI